MIGVGFSSGARYYRYEHATGWLLRTPTNWKPLKEDPWLGLVLLHRSLDELKAQLKQHGYQPNQIPLPEDWFIEWVLLNSTPFWCGLALNWVEDMVVNHIQLNQSLIDILNQLQKEQSLTQAQRHQANTIAKAMITIGVPRTSVLPSDGCEELLKPPLIFCI